MASINGVLGTITWFYKRRVAFMNGRDKTRTEATAKLEEGRTRGADVFIDGGNGAGQLPLTCAQTGAPVVVLGLLEALFAVSGKLSSRFIHKSLRKRRERGCRP